MDKLTEEEQKEIEKHYGLIWKIINDHYKGLSRLTRTPTNDFFQDGIIGLITAYRKYDKSHNVTFATYAVFWIRQSISKAVVDKYMNVIRWPAFCAYELLSDNIGYRAGNPIKCLSHGERFVISGGDMNEMNSSVINHLHLVQDIGLPQHRIDELREMFNMALNRLEDRAKDIMIKRFGLDGNKPMILQEIGELYDLTRERIRQIEEESIEKIAFFLGKDPDCGGENEIKVSRQTI